MVVLFFIPFQFLYLWLNIWLQETWILLELVYGHHNSTQINTHMLLWKFWKLWIDYKEQFGFSYNAQYPELSKNAIEITISKWKALNNKCKQAKKDIETVWNEWISKVKIWKLPDICSSFRLQQDWKAT